MLDNKLGVIPTSDKIRYFKIRGHVVGIVLRHAPLKTGVVFLISILQFFIKCVKPFPQGFCLFKGEVAAKIGDVSTVAPE